MFGIFASYIFFTSLPNTDPNRQKTDDAACKKL